MKCKYCHEEIEQDAQFCPSCGKKLSDEKRCQKCGAILDAGAEFCQECGTRQTMDSSSKTNAQKSNTIKKGKELHYVNPWLTALLALILMVLLYFVFFYSPNSSDEDTDEDEKELIDKSKEEKKDSLKQERSLQMERQQQEDSLLKIVKTRTDSLAILKDSLKSLKENGSQNGKAKKKANATDVQNVPVSQRNAVRRTGLTKGVKNLGYGVFRGTLRNGKPHDVSGRLVFKTEHLIDIRDPKGRVAEPGDYVIGEFYDGNLVQGVWYDVNSQVKGSIIIGR